MKRTPIYELNSENSQGDRNQLTQLVPLVIDHLMHHPKEPFDLQRAAEEFSRHAAAYQIELSKAETERQKLKESEANDFLEFHRKLCEQYFEIDATDDEDSRFVAWSDVVRDPKTADEIGVVRDLFRINWTRPNFDARDKSQLKEYLLQIKKFFDGEHVSVQNHRDPQTLENTVIRAERAPFPKKLDKVYVVVLTLHWKETL
jgi:hypothetical protein